MMDRTDRHLRYLLRVMSKKTLLYSEMLTTGAIIHGDRAHLLDFSPEERPLALQLGGSDPEELALSARIGADWGYDEINLNVGCPSDRVQRGRIGACLMTTPETVARCVEAMRHATDLPVTVKHRIGVDQLDRYEDMLRFVDVVSEAGADRLTVHARIAWLEGLSPKENRDVPPLRYEDVYRLKEERPHLDIEINGGIKTLDEAKAHLSHVDAVMIGRAAYEDSYLFARADQEIFGIDAPVLSRHEVVEEMYPYIERWLSGGGRLHHITRHLLTLFAGQPGTKKWKRSLSENVPRQNDVEVVQRALALVPIR